LVQIRQDHYTLPSLYESADPVARHRIEAAAALMARGWVAGQPNPTFVVGHASAAMLWGLPVPPPLKAEDHLAVPHSLSPENLSDVVLISANRSNRTHRAEVKVRPGKLFPGHVVLLDGLPVTSLARTAVDVMRGTSRTWAVIVADCALRLGCEQIELVSAAEACRRWKGGVHALEMAKFADARAESAAESVARLVVHDHGLPKPDLQVWVTDSAGRRRRLDIAFIERWTQLDVDGKVKYTDAYRDPALALWDEKLREDGLRDVGWEFVRTNWAELVREPHKVAARLRAAFARAEARRAS
jgi:hypothetical protein